MLINLSLVLFLIGYMHQTLCKTELWKFEKFMKDEKYVHLEKEKNITATFGPLSGYHNLI